MEGHNDLLSDDSDSESESDDEVEGEDASKDEDCGESARDNEGSNKPVENSNTNPHDEGVHVVKMRGLPNNVKEVSTNAKIGFNTISGVLCRIK